MVKNNMNTSTNIDIERTITYLIKSFEEACYRVRDRIGGKAFNDINKPGIYNPNKRYKYEQDFAYILNEITAGPSCLVTKNVSNANVLIREIEEL